MASLQKRNGSYRVLFKHHGKLYAFTLGKVRENEANTKARQVDYLLMRLGQGLLQLPEGVDIVEFLRHDGRPPAEAPRLPDAPRQAVTLGRLRDRYLETLGNGTVEANTLSTIRLHLRHFARALGEGLPLQELTLARMQSYIDGRSKDGVSPTTVRKEVASLRAAWNWAGPMGLSQGQFPGKGLRYPKLDEKPPFMTRADFERQVAAGGDPKALSECLYLDAKEVGQLLAHVKGQAGHPWVYPAFCFVAHTGARRSEVLRVLVTDIDLEGNTVLIREKKRSRGQRTHRRVPLTPFLANVIRDWLRVHPGGVHLFCHAGVVPRSCKRSERTGYIGGKNRPTSGIARVAGVRRRPATPPAAITRDEFQDHFKRTLKGSEWEMLRGPHALRHSFISACASRGVDQRILQEWVGHMSAEMSRRYSHLWPSVQQEAIRRVFDEAERPLPRRRRS